MHLPASLKSCRTRPSPAIRSSLCRSTPQPRTTCRGFACSAFRRDRSKKDSKRCSSKANEETQQIATGQRGRNGADRHQIRRGDVRVGVIRVFVGTTAFGAKRSFTALSAIYYLPYPALGQREIEGETGSG